MKNKKNIMAGKSTRGNRQKGELLSGSGLKKTQIAPIFLIADIIGKKQTTA